MRNEQDIRRLMQAGLDEEASPTRTRLAVSRARRQVGQRDTLAFALVRIWAALARLLAPLFARLHEKQASAMHARSREAAGQSDGQNKNQ